MFFSEHFLIGSFIALGFTFYWIVSRPVYWLDSLKFQYVGESKFETWFVRLGTWPVSYTHLRAHET